MFLLNFGQFSNTCCTNFKTPIDQVLIHLSNMNFTINKLFLIIISMFFYLDIQILCGYTKKLIFINYIFSFDLIIQRIFQGMFNLIHFNFILYLVLYIFFFTQIIKIFVNQIILNTFFITLFVIMSNLNRVCVLF